MRLRRGTTGAEPLRTHGLFGPAAVALGVDHVRVGTRLQQTYAVSGYPHEVGFGWLAPLLSAELELSLHCEPFPPALAATRLQKQRARFESTRRLEAERGGLADLAVAAAADDSHELAARLARGESRLLRAGLYLTLSASDEQQLAEHAAALRALCASQLLTLVPTSFRAEEAWRSSLPLALDRLRLRRTFDTEALAASFPFAAVEPPNAANGCFYGVAPSGAPIVFDRFAGDNYNSVILARSGAGKSFLAKLEALRLLYRGVQVFVLDPEDEYARLCTAVGGDYLPLAGAGAVALNPFALGERTPAAVADRVAFLAELLELMGGPLAPGEAAALDRAVRGVYDASDTCEPTLVTLQRALAELDASGRALAGRIEPFSDGAFSSLFNAPRAARSNAPLVCFSLRGLPERLKPVALCLALDAIWRELETSLRRRCVIVDEAWMIVAVPAGAAFLQRLAKSARKRWCGLTTITQDAGDLLASELGHAIVANAACQILLRQAPQAIERVGGAFGLSDGERRYLLGCPRGHGLFVCGEDRFPLQVLASEFEHRLATSDPAVLAEAQ
jgi:type IV secretory pathway VirB4 component